MALSTVCTALFQKLYFVMEFDFFNIVFCLTKLHLITILSDNDSYSVMRYMLRLEISLDEGLERLKSRVQELGPDYDESDDLDSIASTSTVNALAFSRTNRTVRFGSSSRQVETLQNKLTTIEIENNMLRQEVEELRIILAGRNGTADGSQTPEEKKADDKDDDSASVILSEGNVFNLVRGAKKLD